MHVTFAVSSTQSDPASVHARFLEVKTTTPSTSTMSSSSKNRQVGKVGSTSEEGCVARARLECELDGRRYVISTRTCREVVASFESSPKDMDGRGAQYLSCIFPHVTLNVYSTSPSTSDDASWDRLQILARALRDPALASVANDDVETLRPRQKKRKLRHGHDGKVSIISCARDDALELDIQSAFEEQRRSASALRRRRLPRRRRRHRRRLVGRFRAASSPRRARRLRRQSSRVSRRAVVVRARARLGATNLGKMHHEANRLGTVFQLEGHSWFVTQENIDRFQPRGNTRSAAEDDVEANERAGRANEGRGETRALISSHPSHSHVSVFVVERARARARARVHAFSRFHSRVHAFSICVTPLRRARTCERRRDGEHESGLFSFVQRHLSEPVVAQGNRGRRAAICRL